MNRTDFAAIETALGVTLPPGYQEAMASRADLLDRAATARPSFADVVFLKPEDVIRYNQAERDPEATAAAFPRWWKTFVLVATNGGGDYFCLRLKGDRHLWMIGTDCGSRPKKQFETFSDFLDQRIKEVLDPEPEPSSFDESLPLLERFQFRWWDEYCTIRVDWPDRPLTAEKLRENGIDMDELERMIRVVPAAFAQRRPEEVQSAGKPAPDSEGLLRVLFKPPGLADPRLREATVDLFRGNVQISLRLEEQTDEEPPAAEELAVDWATFRQGVIRTLETIHPPGSRASLSELKPDSGNGPYWEWEYSGSYSLTRD